MKITYWTNGDFSVGLSGESGTLELDGYKTKDFFKYCDNPKEARELFRKDFSDLIGQWTDSGRVNILFDDEREEV